MIRQTLWAGALLLSMVVTATLTIAQEAPRWLHVTIEGGGDNEENVAVDLPLQAVGAMMAIAPDGIISTDGRLVVAEDHGVFVSDIRQAWQSIKDADDAEVVTIRKEEQTVRVSRMGDQIRIRVEGVEAVRIDLQLALIDALLSGEGEVLNLVAALDLLITLRGDIVRVTKEGRQIRVWID
jgi:hypothetical protein